MVDEFSAVVCVVMLIVLGIALFSIVEPKSETDAQCIVLGKEIADPLADGTPKYTYKTDRGSFSGVKEYEIGQHLNATLTIGNWSGGTYNMQLIP